MSTSKPHAEQKQKKQIDKRWIELAHFPKGVDSGTSVKLNDDEFIVSGCNSHGDGKVVKYNINTNSWTEFIKYDEIGYIYAGHSILYNHNSKLLYVSSSNDIEHKPWFREYGGDNVRNLCVLDMNAPILLDVNGQIHAIGDFGNSPFKHCYYQQQEWKVIHSFNEYHDYDGTQCDSFIYIPSKNILLLIGGFYVQRESMSYTDKSSIPIGIWKYDIKLNKWNQMKNVKFEGYAQSVALSADENNVIIAGGKDKHIIHSGFTYIPDTDIDTIWILNIENDDFTLKESKIVCPMVGIAHIHRTGYDQSRCLLLTVGWIKQLTVQFAIVSIPAHLIQLIASFYNQEIIHWIKETERKHYAINIKHILST